MHIEGMTAREFMAMFHPDHAWHTATELVEISKAIVEFKCSCGMNLTVTPIMLSVFHMTNKDASMALRNVPAPGV